MRNVRSTGTPVSNNQFAGWWSGADECNVALFGLLSDDTVRSPQKLDTIAEPPPRAVTDPPWKLNTRHP
ncbi:MAG: hypothetical protein HYX73_00820 [Acidobacteria bacterium]|nr:hypothetical protein [Acidobacteriota bacterium]